MKLWNKGIDVDKMIENFTVGNDREIDLHIAKFDVIASIAHVEMLAQINLISQSELDDIKIELNNILDQINLGQFVIEEEFEDVHSKIEFQLTQKLGETGKKIHSARSRNDQVLVALHLYAKSEINTLKNKILELFDLLIELSERHKESLMPGYTHLQVAMPSSFGLWFAAYAESLIDDIHMLNAAYKISDQNPLGSAAGYGSSFPIDREQTTQLMGFSQLKVNSIAAQMSRGKLEKAISFALASTASTISKLSMDITLFMGQNYGFISFPDSLTTGSSIMPHKKNPDVFELIRAKCNRIQALPNEMTLVQNNLPSGYHRDFQILKESLIKGVELQKDCLDLAIYGLQNIVVNHNIMDDQRYKYIYSVEEVNKLVLSGVSFREAYKKIGKDIETGKFDANPNLNHNHIGSIGNLSNDLIISKMKNAIGLG